jgi:hypothetical protein
MTPKAGNNINSHPPVSADFCVYIAVVVNLVEKWMQQRAEVAVKTN